MTVKWKDRFEPVIDCRVPTPRRLFDFPHSFYALFPSCVDIFFSFRLSVISSGYCRGEDLNLTTVRAVYRSRAGDLSNMTILLCCSYVLPNLYFP